MLVLVCFDNGARTLPEVARAGRFGVNVLAAGQEHLARRFASKDGREVRRGRRTRVHDGIPVLDGALAWVGCELDRLVPAATTRSASAPSTRPSSGPTGSSRWSGSAGGYGSLG